MLAFSPEGDLLAFPECPDGGDGRVGGGCPTPRHAPALWVRDLLGTGRSRSWLNPQCLARSRGWGGRCVKQGLARAKSLLEACFNLFCRAQLLGWVLGSSQPSTTALSCWTRGCEVQVGLGVPSGDVHSLL